MAILVLRNITHAFGGAPLLDGVNLRVERGDRVCLFGRNGEGKSTLLRIVAGEQRPDSGAVDVARGATIGALPQEVPGALEGTVYQVVTDGLGDVSEKLAAYHRALEALASSTDESAMARLERAQNELEAAGGWELQHRVETVLSRLGLEAETPFATLSGGWRRRVFLARALALQPDVLLLDEPTNHLDIEAIEWLESFVLGYDGALVFVTHDRAFLRRVATRIVDLDRGTLTEFPADFDEYLRQKEEALDIEERHDALFDKKLADEEVWIRTGIKARRTRNEGRVRALKALREERRQRRTRKGQASIGIQEAERSGEIVVEAEKLTFGYPGGSRLVDGLSVIVKRGDRLGLIGPNGVGKTTLLRLLLGDLQPTSGTIRHGTKLQVRYYDQLRAELQDERTVGETIAPDGDMVQIDGKSKHIISYLRDFLFDADQVRAPVSVLSGGERNRLLLAKLFSEPANVLVLDEPTNDLDIETLEVLEERLLAFDGAILVVSHDREFLNNIATQSLAFEGAGRITLLAGGYEQWERLRAERARAEATEVAAARPAPSVAKPREAKKLTYAERLELEALPAKLEELEAEQADLGGRLSEPDVYKSDEATQLMERLDAVTRELEDLYARWEELESR